MLTCITWKGSITGAYSPSLDGGSVVPSFVLLAVQDTKLVCYVYELINGSVEISKTEYNKTDTPPLQNESPPSNTTALMESMMA
jgi:hypothetical protein